MKTQKPPLLLAFGAHPDDIEFGCGGILAAESQFGRPIHLVVCSRGEAGTRGTPAGRTREARRGAKALGATLEFLNLGGDAHFEIRTRYVLALAKVIRSRRPGIVLAPSIEENQHPDHAKLGRMVRDALRLARYGGLKELRRLRPHACGALCYYAVTPDAEPAGGRLLYDISAPAVLSAWQSAMGAHASQMQTRNYAEPQLTRARLLGERAGVGHALPLFPADPPVVDSLVPWDRGARRY